jgi:hypothetical protein
MLFRQSRATYELCRVPRQIQEMIHVRVNDVFMDFEQTVRGRRMNGQEEAG